MRNTVSGTFNSLSQISNSVASGFSALSMDEEYLQERERMKAKKAKHVGEGLQQGAMSIVKGIGSGIAGVFTKPVEGAASGGVEGFFKGAIKGVTGLVVKPVTGILDAASKATEGIKNTAASDEEIRKEDRIRPMRLFYGQNECYKTYSDADSHVYHLMCKLKDGKFSKDHFVAVAQYAPDKNQAYNEFLFMISSEHVMLFSKKDKKVSWWAETTNIAGVLTLSKHKVSIYLHKETKKLPVTPP
jgi:vacuolar protein sorting-associated protein 13A/C